MTREDKIRQAAFEFRRGDSGTSERKRRWFQRGAEWADRNCADALRDTLNAHFGNTEIDKLEIEDIITQWEERLAQ